MKRHKIFSVLTTRILRRVKLDKEIVKVVADEIKHIREKKLLSRFEHLSLKLQSLCLMTPNLGTV